MMAAAFISQIVFICMGPGEDNSKFQEMENKRKLNDKNSPEEKTIKPKSQVDFEERSKYVTILKYSQYRKVVLVFFAI